MRLFIAVPLPPEIAVRAAACLPPALPGLRPVQPDLMHITLAFLGRVADERLEAAIEAARAAVRGSPAFEVSLDHAGRFPPNGRPRVVWLGIGTGLDELTGLAADVARELRQRAFALEDRPVSPHLTLARVPPDATGPGSRTIAAAIESLTIPALRLTVDRVAVVESRLSPDGPRYTDRAVVPLS